MKFNVMLMLSLIAVPAFIMADEDANTLFKKNMERCMSAGAWASIKHCKKFVKKNPNVDFVSELQSFFKRYNFEVKKLGIQRYNIRYSDSCHHDNFKFSL